VTAFQEAGQLLAQAAQLDPGVRFDVDIDTAFRDALGAIRAATWVVPKEIADSKKAQEQQIQRAQQAAQAMAGAADVATKVGGAVRAWAMQLSLCRRRRVLSKGWRREGGHLDQ
jgi:hypothetical protein